MDIVALFFEVDEFCRYFEPLWQDHLLQSGLRQRRRSSSLCLSEIMTICIAFHQSHYRTFKHYYTAYVQQHWRGEFPNLPSYNRFVELMQSSLLPLCCYLNTRKGRLSGIAFIDSTSLKVCHNRRIMSHKVFADYAQRGKTSVDWFYGFKLHLVINDCGELLAIRLTAGNVDDRTVVPKLVKDLSGKLYGDRGYVSQSLLERLLEQRLQLVTKLKSNMKNKLLSIFDKIMLRRRSLIETVNDQLKNISQIEHSRHRSVTNFLVNLVAGLLAYSFQPKKPSLDLRLPVLKQLPAAVF